MVRATCEWEMDCRKDSHGRDPVRSMTVTLQGSSLGTLPYHPPLHFSCSGNVGGRAISSVSGLCKEDGKVQRERAVTSRTAAR